MTELALYLNKISPQGLAFDVLAQRTIPAELAETVLKYSLVILKNKKFVTSYKNIIETVIYSEFNKRPNISLRQKVLIREQIWENAIKNLNTLALNTAVKHIKIQLENSFPVTVNY